MKGTLKRWAALLIAVLTLGSQIPITAMASEQVADEGLEPRLNYVYIESPNLETTDTERIAISWGDGSEEIERISLTVKNADGTLEEWSETRSADELYLFEKKISDETQGAYEIVSVNVQTTEGEKAYSTSELGIEEAQFEVSEESVEAADTEALNLSEEEIAAAEEAIVTVDQDSIAEAQDSIAEALEEAAKETENEDADAVDVSASASSTERTAEASSKVVVALDPGHDGKHPGASANGLKEEVLTLKIAQYCKEELETYGGVEVFMTRTSESCPNDSSSEDLSTRPQAAADAGAKIYVSLHLNSAESSSAKGAEIIIPNKNWKSSMNTEGEALANEIMDELTDIGLTERSIYTKNSESNTYEDGSAADYYAIPRNCKKLGITGIIVEHAFLTNESDANFLGSESNLKKLGVADATGIADYLELEKLPAVETPELVSATAEKGKITVKWNAVDGADGYRVYRKTADSSWSRIATVSDGSTVSYVDTDEIYGGTKYTYTVRAYRGSELSGYDKTGVSATAVRLLDQPKLVSAVAQKGKITVSWNPVADAEGYRVYHKTADSDWVRIATLDGQTVSSCEDTDVIGGTKYTYTVRAYMKGGKELSTYDKTGVSATAARVVDQPELVSAKAAKGKITVSWKPVADAEGYRVYHKTADSDWTRIATLKDGNASSYADTDVIGGTKYTYTVRAYTKGGVELSTYDKTGVSATAARVVDQPKLVSATAERGKITVKWNTVSGAEGYRVYHKTANSGWTRIATLKGSSVSSYADKTVEGGTKYTYTVRAYTKGGTELSTYDSTGVSATAVRLVAQPALKTPSVTTGKITVKWGTVQYAEGYRVYRKTAGGSWTRIATVKSGSTASYADTNVKKGTQYIYTVRAYATRYDGSIELSTYDTAGVKATAK